MPAEQRIRALLFYLSVLIFLLGLPAILSFSLSYKFDTHTMRFTKTGLIAIKTQPVGADIYLDRRLLTDKSPLTINELIPGTYSLEIRLEKYYPWVGKIRVEGGRVSRLEKIILFPVIPEIKKISREAAAAFWLDNEKGDIYYADFGVFALFALDEYNGNDKQIASLLQLDNPAQKFLLSPDRKKVIYYSRRQIGISYLYSSPEDAPLEQNFILNSGQTIANIFWHSDSYHFILVSDRLIEIWEAKPEAKPITLVNLKKRGVPVAYNSNNDVLYFIDTQKAADENYYDNIYKLELNAKAFNLQNFIKLKPAERAGEDPSERAQGADKDHE